MTFQSDGSGVFIHVLTHTPGAVLRIDADTSVLGGTGTSDPHLYLSTMPTLDDGIFAGWAGAEDSNNLADFATYDPVLGFQRYAPAVRANQVEGAIASDNVRTTAAQVTLTADTAINSLLIAGNGHNLNLGGKRLTIESGGLIGFGLPTISNGQLSAGESAADATLYVLGALNISATITDNAHGGSVALYVGSDVTLNSANTYSGPTIVTNFGFGDVETADAILRLNLPDALPAGNDLFIAGGRLTTGFVATEALSVGTLGLRDGGMINAANSNSDWQPWIDADSYELESGQIIATVSGDGDMTKSTVGTVILRGNYSGYTGDILVEQGILNTEVSLGSSTVTVTGGRFTGFSSGNSEIALTINSDIVLDGGDLGVGTNGDLHVKQDARLLTFNALYVVRDHISADPAAVNLTFNGNVILDDDVTLSTDGYGRVALTGGMIVGNNTSLVQTDTTTPSTVAGVIESGNTNSSVNFVGFTPGSINISVKTNAGQSLTVLFDDVAEELTVSGAGKFVGGGGSFGNSIVLANGAQLLPGSSPGTLTAAQNFTLGAGGVYVWEIAGAAGMTGIASDLLDVLGTLSTTATEANPFVIRVSSLDALGAPGDVADFDPLGKYSWLIAEAESTSGFAAGLLTLDLSAFTNELDPTTTFALVLENDRLYLDVNGGWLKRADDHVTIFPALMPGGSEIPEPTSAVLLGVWALAVTRRRPRM